MSRPTVTTPQGSPAPGAVTGVGLTLAFAEADPDDVDWLGGKGSGLARMTQQGLRVPPGYVIGTSACRSYLAEKALPAGFVDEVFARLTALEAQTGKVFGGGPVPLLLSVRSGAPISMPGMMDTILNLGLSREAAISLAQMTGDSRFVADLVARFHSMYSETVLGALGSGDGIHALVDAIRPGEDAGAVYDHIWAACEQALVEDGGGSVPAEPRAQLLGAIEAVFRSWNTRRARTYRDFHKIPHTLGTAVVVQAMVFGNLSADSGSGVVFTRNPVTGMPGLFGEYLAHSQGEDVVAGTRTPDPVIEALAPDVLDELRNTCAELEKAQGDVLDIEFTVEQSVLYFLQVRSAKRTPAAAVQIAADFLAEGAVSPAAALSPVTPNQVRQVQRPGFDEGEVEQARLDDRLLTTGIGACPGQVSGLLVLDSDRAKELADAGVDVILARPVTSPADLHGMIAAKGIITATGGSTSHAAVVARALGTACVVGAGAIAVDPAARTLTIDTRVLSEGEEVSLDGSSGDLFLGRIPTSTPAAAMGALGSVLACANAASGCDILARVTVPGDVASAREAGAVGFVTAIDDVLAARGHIEGLVQQLLDAADGESFRRVTDLVAEEFGEIFAAAGDVEVGVRAIDLVADESRELLQQTAVTTRHPQLAVPLGVPALVEAQLRGLVRALAATGSPSRVHLAVRHLSDPAEAAALQDVAAAVGGRITVGAYVTSPRAAHGAAGIAEASGALWVEARALQSAVFGIAARHLLTAEPLDGYLRRGLLSLDPRTTFDPVVSDLLGRVAAAHTERCPVGVRLTGEVPQEAAAQLYRLGFRRFAVDAPEARPMMLALGKAAMTG
jgi:pyruvate,orthophosphate dikinase